MLQTRVPPNYEEVAVDNTSHNVAQDTSPSNFNGPNEKMSGKIVVVVEDHPPVEVGQIFISTWVEACTLINQCNIRRTLVNHAQLEIALFIRNVSFFFELDFWDNKCLEATVGLTELLVILQDNAHTILRSDTILVVSEFIKRLRWMKATKRKSQWVFQWERLDHRGYRIHGL